MLVEAANVAVPKENAALRVSVPYGTDDSVREGSRTNQKTCSVNM